MYSVVKNVIETMFSGKQIYCVNFVKGACVMLIEKNELNDLFITVVAIVRMLRGANFCYLKLLP